MTPSHDVFSKFAPLFIDKYSNIPPAVHEAGSFRETGSWFSDRGSGSGASAGASEGRPAALRSHDQARPDAGQSAHSVLRYPEDTGGRLRRSQRQNTNAARESSFDETITYAFSF